MTAARVLVPRAIQDADLKAGTTIAEPDPAMGEVAWLASGSYALDDERTHAGSVWVCVKAHAGRASAPAQDAAHWLRKGPTNRMAPFDDYSTTRARAAETLTYVIQPGFFTGLKLYGCEGAAYAITVRDAPGGSIIASKSGDLWEQAAGLWELLFSPLLQTTEVTLDGIPLSPSAEVSITISAPGGQAALGTVKLGDWRSLIGDGAAWGGAQYGARSERKTYSHRKYHDDGTYSVVVRPAYRDVRCAIVLPAGQALYADAVLAQIADMAVPFEASGLPRYGYLNVLGFVTGTISADTPGSATVELEVKGNI